MKGPYCNTPLEYSINRQAEARGFRFGGHDALKPEERVIKIFRHIAVEQPENNEEGYAMGDGFPNEASFTDYETTDVYIYWIAEEKEYKTLKYIVSSKEKGIPLRRDSDH